MPSENFSETLQARKEQEDRFQSNPAVSKEYFSQQSYPSEMKMVAKHSSLPLDLPYTKCWNKLLKLKWKDSNY